VNALEQILRKHVAEAAGNSALLGYLHRLHRVLHDMHLVIVNTATPRRQ
jgi:hypothetical protein